MKAMIDKEYYVTVRGKALKVYCHNMAHVHPLEYISLPNEGRENYAEIYDKRLVNTDSCPNDGKRDETCSDCVEADPDRSGLTLFSKIRINVTSLQVIGNDFTFARQIKGKKVAYGTAGDCYSSLKNCPQGRFSIDLTGTRLRLSSKTNWATTGQTASIIINQQVSWGWNCVVGEKSCKFCLKSFLISFTVRELFWFQKRAAGSGPRTISGAVGDIKKVLKQKFQVFSRGKQFR